MGRYHRKQRFLKSLILNAGFCCLYLSNTKRQSSSTITEEPYHSKLDYIYFWNQKIHAGHHFTIHWRDFRDCCSLQALNTTNHCELNTVSAQRYLLDSTDSTVKEVVAVEIDLGPIQTILKMACSVSRPEKFWRARSLFPSVHTKKETQNCMLQSYINLSIRIYRFF